MGAPPRGAGHRGRVARPGRAARLSHDRAQVAARCDAPGVRGGRGDRLRARAPPGARRGGGVPALRLRRAASAPARDHARSSLPPIARRPGREHPEAPLLRRGVLASSPGPRRPRSAAPGRAAAGRPARALARGPRRRHRAGGAAPVKLETVADRSQDVLAALGQVIVGKAAVLRQILSGILANGHILIEDYPGLAKTLIARLVSQSLDLDFKRIQFTPDLLPSDITGSFLYDQREGRFEFRRGPIFTNLLLADEINRATPKTQSALLEAMQESQVTIEGERFPLAAPFLVIATQNPIELEGTYPLPEAQLDRFLMRLSVGYPDRDEEIEILARRRRRREDAA